MCYVMLCQERLRVMNPEEDKIFLCVWLLYHVINFCRFTNGGWEISPYGY